MSGYGPVAHHTAALDRLSTASGFPARPCCHFVTGTAALRPAKRTQITRGRTLSGGRRRAPSRRTRGESRATSASTASVTWILYATLARCLPSQLRERNPGSLEGLIHLGISGDLAVDAPALGRGHVSRSFVTSRALVRWHCRASVPLRAEELPEGAEQAHDVLQHRRHPWRSLQADPSVGKGSSLPHSLMASGDPPAAYLLLPFMTRCGHPPEQVGTSA